MRKQIVTQQDRDKKSPEEQKVDPRLLEILICPLTRQPLSYDRAASELVSKNARIAYPIRGGVAIMVPEEARDLDASAGDLPAEQE
jgi:uncharacterized protein YbaR (Trm112 family)